jgi:hypothetical protein
MAAQNNGAAVEPQMPPPKRIDPHVDPVGYLKSLPAVRDRCSLVVVKAKKNDLLHFDVDIAKFSQTVKWVVSIIKVCFQNAMKNIVYRFTARFCSKLQRHPATRPLAAL